MPGHHQLKNQRIANPIKNTPPDIAPHRPVSFPPKHTSCSL